MLARLTDQPALDTLAKPLSQAVRGAYQTESATGQRAKNVLYGVWLGHPLHPVFTDPPWAHGRPDSCLMPWRRETMTEPRSGRRISRSRSGWPERLLRQRLDARLSIRINTMFGFFSGAARCGSDARRSAEST